MSWQPLNLAADAYAVAPTPPAAELAGLFYRGARHLVSGESESAKTLVVWAVALHGIRHGVRVGMADMEMGPQATRRLLDDLGATADELERVWYVEPDRPPADGDIDALAAAGVELVIIDAAAGAYDLSGLDDNKRRDAETFARQWVTPLWRRGVATVVLDHVVKNAADRGKYAIGSERKAGGVDVHLGVEAVRHLTRGGSGLVKVHTRKDRPGFLRRPVAAEIELSSDPDTHALTWRLREPTQASGDVFRPTRLMEKVSRLLEQEPANRQTIRERVKGKTEWVSVAVRSLIDEGFAEEIVPGSRGTLIRVVKPFVDEPFPPFPIVPHRSRNGVSSYVPPFPPPTGGNGNGNEREGGAEIGLSARPLPGDGGHLAALFAALEAGLITAGEWRRGERLHRHLVAAEGGRP